MRIKYFITGTLLIFLIPIMGFADTIILKNGKKIHSSWTLVEKDKVWYIYYGGKIAISIDKVEKIIKDDTVEPAKSVVQEPIVIPTSPPSTSSSVSDERSDPRESASYWAQEMDRLTREKERLGTEIADLKKYRIAIINSRRSTKEINEKIASREKRMEEIDNDLANISDRARKFGVSEQQISEEYSKMTEKEKSGNEES